MSRITRLLCIVVICVIREIESFQINTINNNVDIRCTFSLPKSYSIERSRLAYDQSRGIKNCSSIRRSKSISSTCYLFNRDEETNNNLQQQDINIETIPNNKEENLNKFRLLMGTLYGIAGISHFIDCYYGSSQLLVLAGLPTYYELPLVGQIFAIVWCLVGPLSFVLSQYGVKVGNNGMLADVGLIIYGLVEIAGATFSPITSTIVNAVVVQVVVLAAWIYSRQKEEVE